MFVLKASVWLAAIGQFAPAILQATRTAWAARKTDGVFVRPGKAEFEANPEWVANVQSGAYKDWVSKQYKGVNT